MKREVVGPPISFGGVRAPISEAVRAGGFLFVAGQLGVDESFSVVSGDIVAQTRRALDNLKARLAAGSSSIANVVKVNVFLKQAEDFGAFNEIYAETFVEAPPARTTVVADLLVPGALVEIDAIALIE
jgi:2-iminobutanoate/2-iminopropanoate deaminase